MAENGSGIVSEVRKPGIYRDMVYMAQVLGGTALILGVMYLMIVGLSMTDPNRDTRTAAERIRAMHVNDLSWLKVSCPALAPDIARAIADPALTTEQAVSLKVRAKIIRNSPVKGQVCEIYTPDQVRRIVRNGG